MLSDKYGNPVFQNRDIQNLLYNGDLECLNEIFFDDSEEIIQLIKYSGITVKKKPSQSLTKEEYDCIQQNDWFMPEEYQTFDVKEYCLSKCNSDIEINRVLEELNAFQEKSMLQVLQVLKYIIDHLRKNNILWGVGRGSSVSSYVLYLLGVHKVDSLKYNLDWHEFLR